MRQTIESILVPTDGSDGANVGAEHGIGLAATFGADLHALSVLNTREIDPSLSTLGSSDLSDQEQLLEDETERVVDRVASRARTYLSGRVTTATERGIPSQRIVEYAETHDIDLIVMGTHGRTGLERALLGSVAEKTLRTASVPVVAVPPNADIDEPDETTYRDILVPTDGSEGADIAVEWGLDLADTYDATVHTVYSVDTGDFTGSEDAAELYDAVEQTAQDTLETVRQRARAIDVNVAGTVGSGPAARVILSYSEEHDIDMIVMGTHGRTGIERYLIGSVTEAVVRNADVPVCCVPRKDL